MKISRNIVAFAAAALFLAGGAFAANATNGKLRLYEPVSIQGKQLPVGNYKVEWSGSGPDVQVTILNGKDTVATVPAKVVPTTVKNSTDGYSSAKQPDGSNDLTSIFFRGTSFELKVAPESASSAPQPATSGSN